MKKREVNIDFYKVLENSEIQVGIKTNGLKEEPILVALIDFYNIKDFTKALGYNFFDEGGIEITITYDYIVVRIDDIITDWFVHDIESYRDVIGEYEYEKHLKYKEMTN